MNYIAVFCLVTLLGVCCVNALPTKRGACAVMCSPYEGIFDNLGLSQCPAGYTCRSTGCGTLCVHTDHVSGTPTEAVDNKRGACAIMCSPFKGLFDDLGLTPCPDGSVCQANGCGALCVHVSHATLS